MKRALGIAVAGSLLLLYAWVGHLILTPAVSPAYRAYYIDHTSPLSVAEAGRIRPLEAGRRHGVDAPEVVFNGWSKTRSGRLAPGFPLTSVFVELTPAQIASGWVLTFELWPCEGRCGAMEIRANDGVVYRARELHREPWQLALPASVLQAGVNEIRFNVCAEASGGPCEFPLAVQLAGVAIGPGN